MRYSLKEGLVSSRHGVDQHDPSGLEEFVALRQNNSEISVRALRDPTLSLFLGSRVTPGTNRPNHRVRSGEDHVLFDFFV